MKLNGNQMDWEQLEFLDSINLDLKYALDNGLVCETLFYEDEEYNADIWEMYTNSNPDILYKSHKKDAFYRVIHYTNSNDILVWGRVPLSIFTKEAIADLKDDLEDYRIVCQDKEAYLIIR